jgi:predicted nuclease with TOPRIM domain
MHKNIDKMVTELSKLEVNLRRTGKYEMLNDKVDNINTAINHLEKLVLMANLMK